MPMEDQRCQGTIAQEPTQVGLSHATFLHQIFQHGQGIAIMGDHLVVISVIRFHEHRKRVEIVLLAGLERTFSAYSEGIQKRNRSVVVSFGAQRP